jgi:hypothetical protein
MKNIIGLVFLLASVSCAAQDAEFSNRRIAAGLGLDAPRCNAAVGSLLESAFQEFSEFTNGTLAAPTSGTFRAQCDENGIVQHVSVSSVPEKFAVYRSSFARGGLVLSFVNAGGKIVGEIPVSGDRISRNGNSAVLLNESISMLPAELATKQHLFLPDALAGKTSLGEKSIRSILIEATPRDDCLRQCDMDLDAFNEFCGTIQEPTDKLTCRLNANYRWRQCRSECPR